MGMTEDDSEVVHRCKELVEEGRLGVIRVVLRLARDVVHGCFVIARQLPRFHLRTIPAEIIIKTKSVALSAGAEYKLCLT